jgi:type IV pilus assembly protein PilW
MSATTQRGYTLIELLIGLLLGALAASGAITAYAQASRTYETSQSLGRLNERAQYLLSALQADIQLAGYYGLQGASPVATGTPPAAVDHCGAGLATRLNQPVEALDHYALACPPHVSGVMPGSDVLVLRRASAQPATAEAGRLQLLTQRAGTEPAILLSTGQLPTGLRLGAGEAELRDLLVRAYYVARGSDGDGTEPSLRVKSLTRVAGVPRFVDTEVMPGVEQLRVQCGFRADASAPAGGPRYLPAGSCDSGGGPVIAVQLQLSLRSDGTSRVDGPRRLTLSRSYTLRNAAGS